MIPLPHGPGHAAADDYDTRIERLQRRRHPAWRLVRASIWDFFLLVGEAWPALAGFAFITAVTTLYLVYGYRDHERAGVPPFTLDSALYESMRLMALESSLPIPEGDLFGEVLFFIIPVLGLALVFQSVLNFSRLLLDKSSRIEAWQTSLARTFRNHVIVAGLGSVSFRVTMQLLEAGYEVVVIERDWESEFVEAVRALKVPVIRGDARDAGVLRLAGLTRARSLIAGTHEDLINIEIALAARRHRRDISVVLRIFNDELDKNLEHYFGYNSAFSASALAAPTLATAAVGRSIGHVLPLPHGFAVGEPAATALGVLYLTVAPGGPLCAPVRDVEDRYGVRVLRHVDAQGRVWRTALSQEQSAPERLERGDSVLLLGTLPALEQIRAGNDAYNSAGPAAPARVFGHGQPGAFDTVIVAGLGKVGYRVVQALHQFDPRPTIVAICQSGDTPELFIEEVQALGVRIIYGDARRAQILKRAGIDTACSVVAATSDDLVNLQIGLTARRLCHDVDLVLRVFSDTLAERLTALFGHYTTFSIAALAAPTLAGAAVVRGIDYAVEIAEHIVSTATLAVHPGDEFAGQTVAEIRDRQKLLVIAVRRRGQPLLSLRLDTVLEPGDEAVVLVDVMRLAQMDQRRLLEVAPRSSTAPPEPAEMGA